MRSVHPGLDRLLAASADPALRFVLEEIDLIDPSLNGCAAGEFEHNAEPCDYCERMYARRNGLIWTAVSCASDAGYPVGIAIDPNDPDWPLVYIELPTGQVSWHVPVHGRAYDGHSHADKRDRVRAFIGQVDGGSVPRTGDAVP